MTVSPRPPIKLNLDDELAAAMTRVQNVAPTEDFGPHKEVLWRLSWRGYRFLGAGHFYYIFGLGGAFIGSSSGFSVKNRDEWVRECVVGVVHRYNYGTADLAAEPSELHAMRDVNAYLIALAAFEDNGV